MKQISSTRAREHSDLFAREFDELPSGGQFVYVEGSLEFFSIKINNDYAALINSRGKFILAQKYKNCLSIGSGYVLEYDTFAKIEKAANEKTSNGISETVNFDSQGTFPDKLRALIRKSGLSQRAFAESIGVPLRTLEAWLAGDRTPNDYTQKAVLGRASEGFGSQ